MILDALFHKSSGVTATTSTRIIWAESYGYEKNIKVLIKEAPVVYSSVLLTDGTVVKDEPSLNYVVNLS